MINNIETMTKITLHDKTFRKAIPYEEISKAVDSVAEKINADLMLKRF